MVPWPGRAAWLSRLAIARVHARRGLCLCSAGRYDPGMAHYLFNVSEGDQEQAAALLRAKIWGVGGDEKHRDALVPADLVLIYLAPPKQEFIGQAELASAVHDWTSGEAEVYPGDSPCGVLLSHAEEWDPPVAMSTVVPRIDPEASDPYVQQNAKAGFPTGVVRITDALMFVKGAG
jgi:hypothetical protein